MDYKKLLERGIKNLPEGAVNKERFEIPLIKGHIQGNRTVLDNFLEIADKFGRDPNHLLKYILKELATPGEIKRSGSVMIGAKVSSIKINEKIKKYADEFVLCWECGKPDTKIIEEGGMMFVRCMACGTKRQVKSEI